MKCAAVRRIHGRVGEVFAQSRRVLVEVDDQLRKISGWRCQLAHEQFVQAWDIDRGLMDGWRDLEDEVVSRRLAEEFECTSLVEDQEVGLIYEAEGSVIGNAC